MKEILRTIILAPLSWLYTAGVFLHHLLYSEHILKRKKEDIATIGVSNLAVGGTGKTPMVEYIIRMLYEDYQVAVLSRGYGRKTRGFRLVNHIDDAMTVGDEPIQMHLHFPNIPIAVCRDRVEGIRRLRMLYPRLDCIILDDALQHQHLECGYYILLTTYDNLYVNDHMLPLGSLRDLPMQSHKAQTIIVTKCPDGLQPIEKRIISNSLKIYPFQQLCFSKIRYKTLHLPGTPLIVTGIANPQYLLEQVKKDWPQAQLMAFRDHHVFSEKDVNSIVRQAENFPCVLTTEKDLMRLRMTSLCEQIGDRLYIQSIQVDMGEDAEKLARQLHLYVKENVLHRSQQTSK